jgi:adenosylcobinamide kinase/adenosylcobinamide-phosphate guanylyltransferase
MVDDDPEMAARIADHVARRPSTWTTIEAGADLAEVLDRLDGTALVDALGTWVAGCDHFAVDEAGLCRALLQRRGDTVVVSDEVGLGVHPSGEAGRRFRDVLGSVNAAVADVADAVWLVVAGRPLVLPAAVWPHETSP